MDNANPNLNTSHCKPSTVELAQQATTIRQPTPVRPVSQPAPTMQQAAAPISRQTRSHGPTDIIPLFNQPSPPHAI